MIENDMNARNSTSKNKVAMEENDSGMIINISNDNTKTRKKREELSVSACKCIKKERISVIVKFN